MTLAELPWLAQFCAKSTDIPLFLNVIWPDRDMLPSVVSAVRNLG
jgi:hypothetical protein